MPLLETVVDIETILKYRTNAVQCDIRGKSLDVIASIIDSNKKKKSTNSKAFNDRRTLKQLKEKDCFYLKADKGNKICIMNQHDCNDRMQQLISENPYNEINKNPLLKMIRESDTIRQSIAKIFGTRFKFSLIVSNPVIALMYGYVRLDK